MTSFNQVDLNVRLQLAGCKYSELANTYANNLKYGLKCAPVNLKNLLLLNAMIEILECYKLIYDRGGLIENRVGNGFHAGYIVEVFADGVSISGPITLESSNQFIVATQIADAINGYQSVITSDAIDDGRKGVIFRIFTPCTNPVITSTVDTGAGIVNGVAEYTTLGKCNIDENCMSEEQVQSLLDKIAKLVNLCFQPIGFDYEIPEGYTLNDDGTLVPN